MKIEFLFPEVCSLFGDTGNISYLKKCLPSAEIIETPLTGTPRFLDGDVDFVYMGAMTERTQEKVIAKLLPHTDRLKELIDAGKHFLFTGNAIDILGESISEDDRQIPALGLFKFRAERNMMKRYSGLFWGTYKEQDIVGFRAQFSMLYGDDTKEPFLEAKKGFGMNPESRFEGVCRKNLFATSLIGPLLILNPIFLRQLLASAFGEEEIALPYEEKLKEAFLLRLADYKNPKIKP